MKTVPALLLCMPLLLVTLGAQSAAPARPEHRIGLDAGHPIAPSLKSAELELSFSQRWVLRHLEERHPGVQARFFRNREERLGLAGEEREGRVGLLLSGEKLAPLLEASAWFGVWRQEARDRTFLIEARFLEAEGPPAGRRTPEVSALIADKVRAYMGDKGRVVLQAPKVLTRDAQPAELSIAKQVAYVADYELRRVESSTIADPVVRTVDEGLVMKLCVLQNGDTLVLGVELELSSLERPIERKEMKIPGPEDGRTVVLELPRVMKTRWESGEVSLLPGETGLLVRGLRLPDLAKGGEARFADLILAIERVEGVRADGEVAAEILSVDETAGLCVVRWPEGRPALSSGETLSWSTTGPTGVPQRIVLRATGTSGEGRQLFRLLSGQPRRGGLIPEDAERR